MKHNPFAKKINPYADNGVPIIGQPKQKLACGMAIVITAELIEQLTKMLQNANAEQKAEVGVFFGEDAAFFTFDSFIELVFPHLKAPAEAATGGKESALIVE